MKRDLDEMSFDEPTLRLVEDLIAWLQEAKVEVRLHAHGFLQHEEARQYWFPDRPTSIGGGKQMRIRPL